MEMNLEQQVRLRAYEIWLRDGMAHGRESDHWYAAECEILAERTTVAKPKRKTKSVKGKK